MVNNIESIVLGSGKLYYKEFNGSIPANADIETNANLLGLISGGASLEYKPEWTIVNKLDTKVRKSA